MRKSVLSGGTPVVVRMDMEWIEHLDKAAAANLRSRSAEVKARLRDSMVGESFDAHGCIVKHTPGARKPSADDQNGGGQ